MASVVRGSRQRSRAGIDRPFTESGGLSTMLDQIGTVTGSVTPDAERRRAAITAAEAALTQGWTGELGEVLDVLGLRDGS